MSQYKSHYPKGHSQGYPSGAPGQHEPRAASPAASGADSGKTVLKERFPHIPDTIQLLCGYPVLNTYFDKLIVDDRGNRQASPADAWAEIRMLSRVRQELMPAPPPYVKLNFSCG